jgi:hypothetical protein
MTGGLCLRRESAQGALIQRGFMSLEDTLASWTGPSSPSEQDKQERTERMIREAVRDHRPFADCALSVYAKGSYANNTNVRADSDVDVAVECTEVEYWEESEAGAHPPGPSYSGPWTPEKLKTELVSALRNAFSGQVDTSGSIAIKINSSSARVDADVVPCFTYRYYFPGGQHQGTKLFTTSGVGVVNYPAQQLANGTLKNVRTGYSYKKAVRVLKRIENAMAEVNAFRGLPSYLVECLAYNCPDSVFRQPSWASTIREMLAHIWTELQGNEPPEEGKRWLEGNERLFLFHSSQKWSRQDGRDFAYSAWNHYGFGS